MFVACSSDAPGTATKYTDFSGFVDADQCYNPLLSPDGTKVLFEVLNPSNGFKEVWVVDAVAGSTPTQLVADASEYVYHPAWGPDSDTFVYVHGTGGGTAAGDIYKDTVSSPGSPVLLKSASGGGGGFRPQFNFDGSRVAYIWSTTPQLRCMDDDGTNDGLVDGLVNAYDSNEPPMFSWANTQNLIAFEDGQTAPGIFVSDDTGGGTVQINANGAVVGAACYVSGLAWPANDSFVVLSANLAAGFYNVIRAELDGSDTNVLGTTGPATTQSYFRGALVYENRIWFISKTDTLNGKGAVATMTLTGGGEQTVFDSSLGSGDQVYPFTGGDGWYFN